MKKECSVIRELLPLYIEGMVGLEASDYIKEHLDECKDCAAELEAMTKKNKIDSIEEEIGCNEDIGALKNIKKRIKKKRVLAIIISVLITLIIGFVYIKLNPMVSEYGNSEVDSKADIDSAVEQIHKEFDKWEGCELYSISYAGDEFSESRLEYCNELAKDGVKYSECIVFWVYFRSPISDSGPLNPNEEYNYIWYLARTEDGQWEALTWGGP